MATHAVVLMGPQAPGALRKAMRRVGVEVRRLSDAAAEVHLDEEPALKATEQLSAHEAFDVACLPLEGREKKMLIADMDSTMVAEETLDELAAAFGFGEQVRGITDLSMRGELNFEEALRRRVGLLYGVAIDNALDTIRKRTTVNTGADILVQTMRTRGAHTALVTGGFDVFAGPIGGEIGFKDTYANRLRSVDGVLTGEVAEPILGPDAKAERLALLCQEH
ncbi:MAG: HAD-IB family phosphatase, partial [Pseudomonadota bacterium]